jgi:cytochrome bd ubiquinol oxidase subunit II
MKLSGEMENRARKMVNPLLGSVVLLTIVSLVATIAVRPASLNNYFHYPITFIVPVGVLVSLFGIWWFNRSQRPLRAFLSSALYLFFMLAGACWGVYPTLLPSSTSAERDITLTSALSGPHTLSVGLAWWTIGMILAGGYVVFVYSRFKGKSDLHSDAH